MIRVRDKESGANLGSITKEQLQFLIDQLEEETEEDQDYYINKATLDAFEEKGADPTLITLLRDALGNRDDMEIEWAEV